MLLRIPRPGAPIRRGLAAVLMVVSAVVCSTVPRALVAQRPRVDRLAGLQNVAGAPNTIENCELPATDQATDQATVTNMTLEYTVELALKSSYRVRNVNLSIDRTQLNVRAQRIEASRVSLRQTELRIEEAEVNIRADVQSEVRNVSEFQNRATAMQENFALASGLSRESLDRFRRDAVSALELLQTFQRESDTARNLLDAYLGWRGSISSLQQLTFYDFEVGVPVLERFGIALDGAK